MKIIAEYDSVRRYRYLLQEAIEELKEEVIKTEQAFDDVSTCFEESQYVEFKKGFEHDKKIIDAFNEYEEVLDKHFLREIEILMRPDPLFR